MKNKSNKTNPAEVMKYFNDKLDARRVAAYQAGGPILTNEARADMKAYSSNMADAETKNAKYQKKAGKTKGGKRSVKAKF